MIRLVLLITLISYIYGEDTVKFAVIIYRHGDRTPVQPYPTDPWRNESLWPVKFGELTNTGKQQHYALGQWLRQRYSHLLSEKFNPSEIYVRSTDVDRTLMSAQANLAGMYPPVGSSIWNPDLLWQPIPIHTVPEKEDAILAMKKPCIAYNKEMDAVLRSEAYKKRLSKYQRLMDYLTAYTGENIKDYLAIEYIYNNLYIESLYNFTLPNWTNSVYPDKMREPACYSFTVSTSTPLLARLKVGPLLKEITSKMVAVISDTKDKNPLKLVVYSAHDDTIGCVLNALGLYDFNCPPYTSTIFMELLVDKLNSSHSIRISYRNSTAIVEPKVLYIPYCGEICSIDRFLDLYKNLINVDWEYECETQFSHLLGMSFYIGVGLIVLLYIAHKIHYARVTCQFRQGLGYVGLQPDKEVKIIKA